MDLYRLKIELMYYGIYPSKRALEALPKGRQGWHHRDTPASGGLIVKILPETYVNAPVVFKNTPFALEYADGYFHIARDGNVYKAEVYSPPDYALDNRIESNEAIRNFVMTHTDRIRLHPILGCVNTCGFCNRPKQMTKTYPIELLDKGFQIAREDQRLRPKHTLISSVAPENTLEAYEYLNKIIKYFPEKYPDMEFDLMTAPRSIHPLEAPTQLDYEDFLVFLKDAGIAALSVNLELYNADIRRELIPEKDRIGLMAYLKFIERAVKIFGEYNVRSMMVAGLEPIEDALKGMDEISKRGAVPEISPLVPMGSHTLSLREKPTPDFLEELLIKTDNICRRNGVNLNNTCTPCKHNVLTLQ